MKTVYPSDEIAHLFIHQAQSSARNPQGNFSFSGPVLLSYSQPLAYIMPDVYGRMIIVNTARYSNTTSKQQSRLYRAIGGGWKQIDVDGFGYNEIRDINRAGAADICGNLVYEMRAAIDKAAAPRIRPPTRESHLRTAGAIAADIRTLATIDAKRKDISKENRAAARKLLASLPSVDALRDAEASQAAAAALAAVHARQIAEERMYKSIGDAQRAARQMEENRRMVEYYAQHPTAKHAWMTPARNLLNCAGSIRSAFNGASDAAKLARKRLPPRFVKECREVIAQIPELNAAALLEARAGLLAKWDAIITQPVSEYSDKARELRVLATELAFTDSDEEKARRVGAGNAAVLEYLRMRADTAPDRCHEHLSCARAQIANGYTEGAARSLRAANAAAAEAHATTADALRANIAATAAELEKATAAEREQALADWYAGKRQSVPEYCHADGALLRIAGDQFQTSRGARVPLTVAPMLWRMVTRTRAAGVPAVIEPPRSIGHYQLEKIGADGSVTIGCHFIQFAELAKMAAELGYEAAP